jgi:hypothetical protein
MPLDFKLTAEELRLEATKLREKAKQLEQAAQVLDPSPSQKDLLTVHPPSAGLSGRHSISAKLFSDFTVTRAAEVVLQEAGNALSREEIFEQINKRGGSVSSVENLISALSRSKDKFVSLGNRMWDLKERLPAGQRVFV